MNESTAHPDRQADNVPDQRVLPGLRRIQICGLVAFPGKPARGGFQSANLRLMSVMTRLGARVGALRYPEVDGSFTMKGIAYLKAYLGILARILVGSSRGGAIHFTPLAKYFLPFEVAVGWLARARGYKVIVDIRAGNRERLYRERGSAERLLFRLLLKSADVLGFEGWPYDPFLAKLAPEKPRFWLPNFVPSNLVKHRESFDAAGPKLVYVGAVSEAKGAEAAARLAGKLRETLTGTTLTFVGRYEESHLASMRAEGLLGDWVRFVGAVPLDDVAAELDRSHFFIFLSLWRGEGHSNALTEAMARGCLPIVTRHGFNQQAVGDTGFIVEDRDRIAGAADWIGEVWAAEKWQDESRRVVDYVAENFTDRRIEGILRSMYSAAFQ